MFILVKGKYFVFILFLFFSLARVAFFYHRYVCMQGKIKVCNQELAQSQPNTTRSTTGPWVESSRIFGENN